MLSEEMIGDGCEVIFEQFSGLFRESCLRFGIS
jgi:hypothetical protein